MKNNGKLSLFKISLFRLFLKEKKNKFIFSLYKLYESILPPQNITLLELKRKEFKERTKYLDLKILYNLTEEEKKELRKKGYYVDLSDATLKKLSKFSISTNRHQNRYCVMRKGYNDAIISDYYYTDQLLNLAGTDYQFEKKTWGRRYRIKRFIGFSFFAYIYCTLYYYYKSSKLPTLREESYKLNLKLTN